MSYIKVSDLAGELGLSPARVHQLIRKGLIKTFTLTSNGEKYIERSEADRFKELERKPGRIKIISKVEPGSIFKPIERKESDAS